MSLQNLQAEFAEAIFSDQAEVEILQPMHNLKIYSNNIFSTCIGTLEKTYPLIVKLVGQEYFRYLAKDYIKRYPSRSCNLNEYGMYFADFLGECPALKDLIYLAEVALFEWTCHCLQFAAEATPFDIDRLGNIAEAEYPNLHLILHPASKVIKFYFPILAILDLCDGTNKNDIDINQGGINLLISRRDYKMILTPLEDAEFVFLQALQENQTIENALIAALRYDKNFPLQAKLPLWISNRFIVGCKCL